MATRKKQAARNGRRRGKRRVAGMTLAEFRERIAARLEEYRRGIAAGEAILAWIDREMKEGRK